MITDGRTVPAGEEIRTDICVVGAGPAGITVARRLAEEGRDVILLERGSREGTGAREDLGTSVNRGTAYLVDKARGTGVGGAVHKWLVNTPLGAGFGRLREFAPDDFSHRPWIPYSGWPFDKAHLQPWYGQARKWFDVPWPSETPESLWDSEHASTSLIGSDPSGLKAELFSFADPSPFASSHVRRLERADHALILTHSIVTGLNCEHQNSVVSSVDVRTEAGSFRVLASRVVLAAGAVENARLLLLSRTSHPAGIGNHYDLVGRFFMEHPRFTSGLIRQGSPLFGRVKAWDIHLLAGIPVQWKYRFDIQTSEHEALPNSIYFFDTTTWSLQSLARLRSERDFLSVGALQELRRGLTMRQVPPKALRNIGRVVSGPDAIVAALRRHRSIHSPSGTALGTDEATPLTIEVMAEQVPNPRSRVTLDRRLDHFGLPKAAVHWHLSALDEEAAARGQLLFSAHLEKRGLGPVLSTIPPRQPPFGLHSASHHMGTTRMHSDPHRGVVDANSRVHGTENLFVAGSSVFPTGGDANPTLTIVALALRLADYLVREPLR